MLANDPRDPPSPFRALPKAVEIEDQVLAALCDVPNAFARLSQTLELEDFYNLENRTVWRYALELVRDGQHVDGPTLTEYAVRLNDQRAAVRLVEAHAGGCSGSNLEQYARILRDRRLERELLKAANMIGERVYGPGTTDDKIEKAQRSIMAIGSRTRSDSLHTMATLLPRVAQALDDRRAGRRALGLSTGFVDLDRRWQGLTKGDVFVIAGRPSMGKTTLAMNIAENVAIRQGRRVLVFSLEMTADQLAERTIANLASIPLNLVRDGKCLDDLDAAPRFARALAELRQADLVIDDGGAITIEDVRARVRAQSIERPVDLIVIDYLQLMHGPGFNANERVAGISRGVKALAKEAAAPVLLLSQLSREVEKRDDKRPQMSDLRDSGALEQDGDVIAFVYRDVVYNEHTKAPNAAEILTRKFRNGKPGRDFLFAELAFSRFRNFQATEPDYGPPPRNTADQFEDFET